MAGRWRPVVLLVALLAGGVGGAATLGAAPAFAAAQTAGGSCSAQGYRTEVAVKYRRAGSGLYIGSVGLKIDEQAGPRNRVRLVVARGGETVFNYDSGPRVTAGPYLFDYQSHPIKVPLPGGGGQIRVDVTVDFDSDAKASCTATVRM